MIFPPGYPTLKPFTSKSLGSRPLTTCCRGSVRAVGPGCWRLELPSCRSTFQAPSSTCATTLKRYLPHGRIGNAQHCLHQSAHQDSDPSIQSVLTPGGSPWSTWHTSPAFVLKGVGRNVRGYEHPDSRTGQVSGTVRLCNAPVAPAARQLQFGFGCELPSPLSAGQSPKRPRLKSAVKSDGPELRLNKDHHQTPSRIHRSARRFDRG